MPIPYALRSARFTAPVSATLISAPRTSSDTLEASASPYPTKPRHAQRRRSVTTAARAYVYLTHRFVICPTTRSISLASHFIETNNASLVQHIDVRAKEKISRSHCREIEQGLAAQAASTLTGYSVPCVRHRDKQEQ